MEDDVLRRAQEGDPEAFRSLVEAYTPLAWRLACSLLGDPLAAEDAVQEAWVDVWRALPRFRVERSFRPWLTTLVANRCRSMRRRRSVPTIALHEALVDDIPDRESATDAPAPDDDADLAAALRRLPAEQRQVLRLRYFADLELAEIALVTGLPLGTVKSRLHRALAALRSSLSVDAGRAREGGHS